MALEFAEFSVHDGDLFDIEGVPGASTSIDNVDSVPDWSCGM